MTQTPDRGPDPKGADVGQQLRQEVERAAGSGEQGAEPDQRDDPAFTQEDGGMDVPPPG